jgi:hypothetical protein
MNYKRGKMSNGQSGVKGIRANASCKSHAELDEATELDRGNPQELGDEHKTLKHTFRSAKCIWRMLRH